MELTKVSTCVHGSPHFGHDSVFLSLPGGSLPPSEDFLPPPPDALVGGGGGGAAAPEPAVVVGGGVGGGESLFVSQASVR